MGKNKAKITPTGQARVIKAAPGKGKASGKGDGKGQGQWVWMPQAAPMYGAPMRQMPFGAYGAPMRPAPFGGKMAKMGKAGAGLMAMQQQPTKAERQKQETREKLRKVEASKKVWVGNMSKKTTWQELRKHFSDIAKPTVVDVNEKNGTGVVCFGSEEDASSAIAVLNGSELGGEVIEVDVWTKPEREPKEEGAEKKKKVKKKSEKQVMQVMQVTGAKKEKEMAAKAKMAEKLRGIDHSLKVWVGGLSPSTNWQKLKNHFTPVAKPTVVDIMKKGQAVVAFDDVAHVEEAISTLNGTEIDGKTIEVDSWTKPERKEKKGKSD